MNPNSANQVWSRWTFTVTPSPRVVVLPFAQVRENCARFGRKAFGSASEMHVRQYAESWIIDVRTEGAPVQDLEYVSYMIANWKRFLRNGFGGSARITVLTRLEAGSPQDGTPATQLIMVPPIPLDEVFHQ